MCSITNIQQAKWQRQRDMHNEKVLIGKEQELERSLAYVREQLQEVRNRLGTNNPEGPEVA